MGLKWITGCGFAFALCGCSTVMEFNRPDPVDLSQFQPGQHRLDVVKVLGPPLTTVNDGPKSCDVYQLYTHGPGGAGKAGIIFVEGVTDVFTLGLAELVSTPVEAGTKNSLYAVTMCYSQDATLLSVEESGKAVNASVPPATASDQVAGTTPPATVNASVPPATASDQVAGTTPPATPAPAVTAPSPAAASTEPNK